MGKLYKLIEKSKLIVFSGLRILCGKPLLETPTAVFAVLHWIEFLKPTQTPLSNKKIVVCALRNQTWIEWAVFCAIYLRKFGISPVIVFRSSEVNNFYSIIFERFNFWAQVRKLDFIEFVDLENQNVNIDTHSVEIAKMKDSIIEAIAYNKRVEPCDVVDNINEYKKEISFLEQKYAQVFNRLPKLLTSDPRISRVICYSGIIEDSPAILKVCLDNKKMIVLLEGWWRPGQLIYNINKPALEFNIQFWFAQLDKIWGEKQEKEIDDYISFLEGKQKKDIEWLENFYLVQKSNVEAPLDEKVKKFLNESDKPLFLLSPNVIGDSATINRTSPFKGQKDWIEKTIDYFRKNKTFRLIIRAHPAEVWMKAKVKTKLGDYASSLVTALDENILVIPSEHPINTFSIIPRISAGLLWVSTVGVDMVIKGKKIINAANPKYDGIGITSVVKSQEQYFELINKYAISSNFSTKEEVVNAKKYHYMVYKKIGYMAQGPSFRADSINLHNVNNLEFEDFFMKIAGLKLFEELEE